MPVTISWDASGRISGVTIPRPQFTPAMHKANPTTPQQDIRHVVAWAVLQDLIIQDLKGKTEVEARDYLTSKGISDAGSLVAGLTELAKKTFNDPGNASSGARKPNRALGGRIPSAKRRMGMSDDEFPQKFKMDVHDDDGSVSTVTMELQNQKDAEDIFYNMALDWRNADDVERARELLLSLIDHNARQSAGGGSSRPVRRSRPNTAPDRDNDANGDPNKTDTSGGEGRMGDHTDGRGTNEEQGRR